MLFERNVIDSHIFHFKIALNRFNVPIT